MNKNKFQLLTKIVTTKELFLKYNIKKIIKNKVHTL